MTKVFDPTANPFELLADESTQVERARPAKVAKETVTPTPAARAQARKAQQEEVTKAAATKAAEEEAARKAQPIRSTKAREDTAEWTETQRKKPKKAPVKVEGVPPRRTDGRGEAPRQRGAKELRGRGAARGAPRGVRGRAAFGKEDRLDRRSGMARKENPSQAKRSGSGQANWGDAADLKGDDWPTSAATAAPVETDEGEGWVESQVAESPEPTEVAAAEGEGEAGEAVEGTPKRDFNNKELTMDDYAALQAEKQAQLLALLNAKKEVPAPAEGEAAAEVKEPAETPAAELVPSEGWIENNKAMPPLQG